MQEVKRFKTGHDYDAFLIQTDYGDMEISFQGNLDLYWRYIHHGDIRKHQDSATIIITKENYTVYDMFDRLYNRIVNRKPFGEEETYECYNNWLYDARNEEALVKGSTIEWRSDDFYYDIASGVKITPFSDEYHITFTKSKEVYYDGMFMTFAIRFRNSGSRYDPYNAAFMLMYRELQDYEPEFHQYHIEEMLFEPKKRILRKEEI